MSTILQNGSVQFGDGTVQSTKTPSNVSAFTNDSGYLSSSVANSNFASKTQTVGSISASASRSLSFYYYNVSGALVGAQGFNCNCNC